MGAWHTIHLFDDTRFYSDLLPNIKNIDYDLKADFLNRFRHNNFSDNELDDIVKHIRLHIEKINKNYDRNNFYDFEQDYGEQAKYLPKDFTYYLPRFMEFMLFSYCADFYPHLPTGKHGYSLHSNSVASSIFDLLNKGGIFITDDYMGIVGWITKEEVELLYHSKNEFYKDNLGLINLINKAFEHNLGLILGVDMRDEILEKLPSYKFTAENEWNDTNLEGLIKLIK
ncbi:MAG: hypothetical protein RLZZ292_1165 [Bacteroidota bacterium]|jgi:hypothetical protein